MDRSTLESRARDRLLRAAVVGLWAVAALAVVYLGFVRARAHFLSDYDTRFWFVGGVALWKGASPYEHATFIQLWIEAFGERPVFRSGYVYPPTILPLSLLLGALPWSVAAWAMKLLNVGALAGAALLLRREVVRPEGGESPRWVREACIALACALPAAGQTIHQGQVSLLVVLGLVLFWAGSARGRVSWVAIGGVLALIKPQITLPALIFVLASRRSRLPWLGFAAAAVVGCSVFLWTSPDRFVIDLGVSLSEHMEQTYNRFDRYDTLPGLFGGTSLARVAVLAGIVVACGAAALLGRTCRDGFSFVRELRTLQVVVALGTVLMPVHHYDFAIELILVGTAWCLGRTWRAVVLIGLVFAHSHAYWLTQRFIWQTGLDASWLEACAPVAGGLGIVILALLLFWWVRDRVGAPRESGSIAGSPAENPMRD